MYYCTWLVAATLCNHPVPPVDVSIAVRSHSFPPLLGTIGEFRPRSHIWPLIRSIGAGQSCCANPHRFGPKEKKNVGPTFLVDIYGIDCHVKVFLDVAFLGCLPGEMMMSVWNAVAVPVLLLLVGTYWFADSKMWYYYYIVQKQPSTHAGQPQNSLCRRRQILDFPKQITRSETWYSRGRRY